MRARCFRLQYCYSLALLVPLLIACGEGSEVIQPPPPDSAGNGGDGGDSGTVQRARLNLDILVDAADAEVATALGWGAGVPQATVTIVRACDTDGPVTATTDNVGHVELIDLLPGSYSISVLRTLAPAEMSVLGLEHADVTAFGGGDRIHVEAPAHEAIVHAVAGRRGTLVFGELFGGWPQTAGGGRYQLGHYIELVNNGAVTVYLDGKVLGRGISWLTESPYQPCSKFEKWRVDPAGIWTGFRYKIPGSGRAHPLHPGETAVIATDAINHQEIIPGLDDLRNADFEFIGSSDVDNPTVPNMINMGPVEWAGFIGHGQYLSGISMIWVLSEAVEEQDLAVDYLPVNDPEFRRLPADMILDVFTSTVTPERQDDGLGYDPCQEFVHPRFDRNFAALVDLTSLQAMQRAVFATESDGRTVLQRTRTSARDFIQGLRSPGTLP